MLMKKLGRNWNRIIISAAVISILFMLILSVSQIFLISRNIEATRKNGRYLTEITMSAIDREIGHTMDLATSLMLDPSIDRFMYQERLEEGDPNIYNINRAMRKLYSVSVVDDMISEIYAYSSKSGYLIEDRNFFSDIEGMYSLFSFRDLSARQWISDYLRRPYTQEFRPSTEYITPKGYRKVIPYCTGFPVSNPSANKGKIIILLDEDRLLEDLKGDMFTTYGFYILMDRKSGTVIARSPSLGEITDSSITEDAISKGRCRIGKNDYYISKSRGMISGLDLITGIDMDYADTDINKAIVAMTLVSTVFLAAGLSVILVTMLRKRKDWDRLMELSRRTDDVGYEEIADIIDRIGKNEISGHEACMLDYCFQKIIDGETGAQELTETLELSIERKVDDRFIVCRLVIPDRQENISMKDLNFMRILSYREAVRIYGSSCYTYLDKDGCIWIVCWGSDSPLLSAGCRATVERIRNLSPVSFIPAVSRTFPGTEGLLECIGECSFLTTIALHDRKMDTVLEFWDIDSRATRPILTRNTENQLLNNVRSGSRAEISRIFETIYRDNYVDSMISVEAHKRLLSQLHTCAQSLSLKERTHMPDQFGTLSDACGFFLEQCSGACESKKNAENMLIEEIDRYIRDNCSDPGLTLGNAAEALGRKESYLYHFMMTRMNRTFAEYLEDCRMEKASDMLHSNPDLQINEAAAKCGYYNTQTFRRVFRKHFGLLPSDFLKRP